jgi:hypothetical protein
MAKKTISTGENVDRLDAIMKEAGGNFSARLDEIVGRYNILLDLEALPNFSEVEMAILGEVICGSVIDRRKVRGLHLDVLDAALGTEIDRAELSTLIESMSIGQRLKLIETLGQ